MLMQPTLEQLHKMRLHGMAEAFRRQLEDPHAAELSFEDRFGMLVESQWVWKESRALARRLSMAKLKVKAALEDVDFRHPRGLDRARFLSMAHESRWVRLKQNVVLIGPTGIGKSYLACALGQKACRDGYKVMYTRAPQLFRDLRAAQAEGTFLKLLRKVARMDALIVDDWAMDRMEESDRRDFLEICDDRFDRRSTVLTSQLPTERWHDQVGDPTVADSILDRLVHNAHLYELRGESLRKVRGKELLAGKTEGGEA